MFSKINPKEYRLLNLAKYGTGKGIKVGTLETVGTSDMLPYKIISNDSKGSRHGKTVAITHLMTAPGVTLYSLGSYMTEIDYKTIKDLGIDIVFASMGGHLTDKELDDIRRLKNEGVIFVTSMGNEGSMGIGNNSESGLFINVGAVGMTSWGEVYCPDYSIRSGLVDFASFGTIDIPHVKNGNLDSDFAVTLTGTSMACPILAGLIAIILELGRNRGYRLNQDQVYRILKDNAHMYDLDPKEVGHGVVTLPNDIDFSLYKGDDKLVEFNDLDKDRYSTAHILALAARDIITGYEDGSFRPDDPVTREQVAVLLNRLRLYLENK